MTALTTAARTDPRAPAPRRSLLPAALGLYVLVRLVGLLALFTAAPSVGLSGYGRLVRWDAFWYSSIAAHGYGFQRVGPGGRTLTDLAFFPLYPALERVLAAVTGLRYVDAGVVITALCSLAAAWGIFAVTARCHGGRAGVVAVVLWAAVPVGIVESMAYSEALFTALAAWCLHAVLTRRWLVAGTLASLAGLTRPVGVAVVAAVLVGAGATVVRRDPDRLRAVTGALLAPLGWLAFVIWVALRRHDPMGYFAVGKQWGNGFDGGRAFATWVTGFLSHGPAVVGVLLLLAVLALLGLLLLSVRDRQPLPLVVYSTAMVFLALTSSGYFGSKPRYLLPAFALLLPLAVRLVRLRPALRVTILVVLTLASSAYGAFWLLGAGPP